MIVTEQPIQVTNPKLKEYFERFDEELNALFSFMKAYTEEDLNKKPNDKSWSVMQVIHHLMISEEGALNYVKKRLTAGKEHLKKASTTSKLRAMVLVSSMKQPIKLTAPPIACEGIPEYADIEETKNQWILQRNKLYEFLSEQSSDILESECYKHPITGRMDIWGMLDFFEAHFQRHFKQINKTAWKVVLVK
jgi:hypothetical protein